MRSATLRDVRQRLSVLLNEIRKGREVIITERGHPIARLVPMNPVQLSARPFPSHRWLRDRIQVRGRPLSEDLEDERADRV